MPGRAAASPKCAPKRQAHILVIDINKGDEDAARERALRALQAFPKDRERCTIDGFSEGGRLYGPLVGENAVPEKIYPELIRLGRNLRLRAEAGFTQDVVFVYYECGERVTAQTHVFRTFDSASDPELKWSGIPCEHLRSFFGDYFGSLVLLLDVTRDAEGGRRGVPAGDMVAHWPADPHVAVLRYAWRDDPKKRPREDTRLILDLRKVWPESRKLADVLTRVGDKFERSPQPPRVSRKYRGLLTLDEYVAPGLRDLPIGQ